MTQRGRLVAAAGSWVMAALTFAGVVFDDLVGRILVGVVWLVPAVGWTLQYCRRRRIREGRG